METVTKDSKLASELVNSLSFLSAGKLMHSNSCVLHAAILADAKSKACCVVFTDEDYVKRDNNYNPQSSLWGDYTAADFQRAIEKLTGTKTDLTWIGKKCMLTFLGRVDTEAWILFNKNTFGRFVKSRYPNHTFTVFNILVTAEKLDAQPDATPLDQKDAGVATALAAGGKTAREVVAHDRRDVVAILKREHDERQKSESVPDG
jgi:hypothetical protein